MSGATGLKQMLSLTHPIIQAPMAGGGDTPELVAAVCETGGSGFVGAAYLTPAQIDEAGRAVRARTSRPFGINLFAPSSYSDASADPHTAIERLAPFYRELGLSLPAVPSALCVPFDDQLAAAIASGAAAFSFTFGILPPQAIAAIKASGLFLMGTATTVEEAVALEQAGVDAVIAQGSEAGGHRGTFIGSGDGSMVGTMALVPQVVDAVKIPVIASGGIMDGRGIAAALALGADAVQMGTAFLTCDEAGIPEAYKQRLLETGENETRLTRAFSGRFARGIVNRFMTAFEQPDAEKAILPFPLQNALTRPLRSAAAKLGKVEYLSLWAGQGTRMSRRRPAATLVAELVEETNQAIRRLSAF